MSGGEKTLNDISDRDGQPVALGFNYGRNRQKHIHGLLGILHGLVSDNSINETEVFYLENWLKNAEASFSDLDGDYKDLVEDIAMFLEDGKIDSDELADLKGVIETIIDYSEWMPGQNEDYINHFLGLLDGILSDGKLKRSEVFTLSERIAANTETLGDWPPLNHLRERIENILADNQITEDEIEELHQFLKEITGNDFIDTGLAHGYSTHYLEDDISEIDFESACICFTGKFLSGTRKAVEAQAKDRGACCSQEVTNKVTHVVKGSIASRDWIHRNYGRKIQKALKLKTEGKGIKIIGEDAWKEIVSAVTK